jgi:phosphotriesterase-related protein
MSFVDLFSDSADRYAAARPRYPDTLIDFIARSSPSLDTAWDCGTGNGQAAMEELRIIESKGVNAAAWIWIHAQNEKNRELHIRAAKAGGWVSYDGVHSNSISDCIEFLKDMKTENQLKHVLLSQDSGWYHVGDPGGGDHNAYNTIADKLIPAMKEKGFSQSDIDLLFTINPAMAFTIRVRKNRTS